MANLAAYVCTFNRGDGSLPAKAIGCSMRHILKSCSPKVLGESYFYICSFVTGEVLMLESLPVPLWTRDDNSFLIRIDGNQLLEKVTLDARNACEELERTDKSQHAFVLNPDGLALCVYKKKVCDWIVKNKKVKLRHVPRFIARVAKRGESQAIAPPPVIQNAKLEFDLYMPPITMYSLMAGDGNSLGWGQYSKKTCGACGAAEDKENGKILKGCGQCKQVRYCSKDCQTTHWGSTHKAECKELLELCPVTVSEVEDFISFLGTFRFD